MKKKLLGFNQMQNAAADMAGSPQGKKFTQITYFINF